MMHYRSISSHRGSPDPRIIELAARLGFNDVCFQTEGDQDRMLRELRDRTDRSGTFDHVRSLGMSLSLWVHEFEDLDPAWGALAPDNETLWGALRERYTHLLTRGFPEIDWLVLTVVESTVRVTEPAMLERLVLLLRDVCAVHGKRLMLRSFVWTLDEFHGVRETIARLPDDVPIMTKYVPQDWHRGDNHDPLIGRVGAKEQIIELDLAGEYFRGDQLGHCFAEELHRRFAFWTAQGVDGLSVRIDRGWKPQEHQDHILHQVQESNLWCLGHWATGKASDIDSPLRAWATERYGSAAAGEIAAIARLCDPVVREALTVCGEPFGDTRNSIPAMRSMLPSKEPPATLAQPAATENLRDPFCRWLSLWRWDASLVPRYEKLRAGHPDCFAEKQAAYAATLAKADEALDRLEAIRGKLDPAAYAFLRFKLEENRHHLILMCEAALAWLAVLRIPHGPGPSPLPHLDAMMEEWKAHRHEAALVPWQGRVHHLIRCASLDVPGFRRELLRYAGIRP